MSKRRSEWPGTPRVDSIFILHNVHSPQHESRALKSDGASQFVDVQRHVENRLGQVGVKVRNGVAKLFHVLRQKLVRIGNSIVHVAHFVEGESW